MKVFLDRTLDRKLDAEQVEKVNCNQCGREIGKNVFGYLEDHLSVTKTWGYGTSSDGETQEFELCFDCYSNMTEKFVIPPRCMSSLQEFEVSNG